MSNVQLRMHCPRQALTLLPIIVSVAMTVAPTRRADGQAPSPVSDAQRQELLAVRDSVWRAFYTNDQAHMRALVPANLIAINPGDTAWQSQADFLSDAQNFSAHGVRLISLTFPRTEIQLFGPVAVLYSTYALRLEVNGAARSTTGRATEVFVRNHGRWVNPGWHLDAGR